MSFPKIISLIFHPLWMPTLIYLCATTVDPMLLMDEMVNYYVLILLLMCIIAPALSMMIMVRFGMLSGLELKQRTERTGPYMLVMFYFILCYVLLKWRMDLLPQEIFRMFLAVIVSLAVALAINLSWKISVHMLAQGGLFGTLLALNYLHQAPVMGFVMLSILVAGFTGYARVQLDAHTPGQVYAGFLLGTVVNVVVIMA